MTRHPLPALLSGNCGSAQILRTWCEEEEVHLLHLDSMIFQQRARVSSIRLEDHHRGDADTGMTIIE